MYLTKNIIEIIILPIQYFVYTNLGLAVLDGHTLSPWTLAWLVFELIVGTYKIKNEYTPTAFSIMLMILIVIIAIIAIYPVFFLDNRNPILVSTLSYTIMSMIYSLVFLFFKKQNKEQNLMKLMLERKILQEQSN